MTIKDHSTEETTPQEMPNEDLNREKAFRYLHRSRYVLVNPSDLEKDIRIMWWKTGLEEGVFTDHDIPSNDYQEVYEAMHGR